MSQLTIAALLLPVGAFVVSGILTGVVRRWSIRTEFVARPREDRYHHGVIALGGGVAIFWTIAIFLLGAVAAVHFLAAQDGAGLVGENIGRHLEGFINKRNDLLIVIGCAFALHLMGLWDDKKHLSPKFKLLIQFAATFAAAWFADIRVEFFIQNKLITTILSVFWMVLIINAFNFLDNMDGTSAGIAAIATTVLMTAAFRSGQVFVGALALILLGTLLGFLVFNFPPAKIFMGDGGSLVIGFFVALLTLRTTYYDASVGTPLTSVFMPAIVMAVPLYDFTSVTFLRLRQGKSPFVGDTQHFSHRLKRRGLSDTQVALTLYLATLGTGIGAIVLQQTDTVGAILIAAQTLLILLIIAILEAAGKTEEA